MDMPVPAGKMPGLASEEDLARLRAASGPEAAKIGFELMTAHHRGGLHMARAATTRVKDPEMRALAERIARNQRIEINEYAAATRRLGLT
jgi:uncharacterized protein (DUF305 family)